MRPRRASSTLSGMRRILFDSRARRSPMPLRGSRARLCTSMTDATRFQFNNPSVPQAYDDFFVPSLLQPWAKLWLEAADLRRGESVLDVATGPGTVARLAAVRLGAEGRVVATDIAQPMLDIAKAKAPPGGAPIEYLNSPAAPLAAAT